MFEDGSAALTERLVVVGKDISIPHFIFIKMLNSLCAALDANRDCMNPSLDFRVVHSRKIEHCDHFRSTAKV